MPEPPFYLLGVTADSAATDIVRGAVQGIAFSMKNIVDAILLRRCRRPLVALLSLTYAVHASSGTVVSRGNPAVPGGAGKIPQERDARGI